MKTPKHTPGPWQFIPVGQGFLICTADGPAFIKRNHYLEGAPMVARTTEDFADDDAHADNKKHYEPKRDPERGLANARLIALAPEMLEALQEINHTHDKINPAGKCICSVCTIARRIVAKATA